MKKLKWGKTYWDKMTKDQLLMEVWKMFSAITSMQSCLKVLSSADIDSLYWGKDGSGGRALGKASQVLAKLRNDLGEYWEQYPNFFRYANDLLFNGLGDNWVLCDTCGSMVGGKTIYEYIGKSCKGNLIVGKKNCKGKVKKLEWKDLREYKAKL